MRVNLTERPKSKVAQAKEHCFPVILLIPFPSYWLHLGLSLMKKKKSFHLKALVQKTLDNFPHLSQAQVDHWASWGAWSPLNKPAMSRKRKKPAGQRKPNEQQVPFFKQHRLVENEMSPSQIWPSARKREVWCWLDIPPITTQLSSKFNMQLWFRRYSIEAKLLHF